MSISSDTGLPPRQLTAREAAVRLGVKVETIYAYVSRGMLDRVPSPDGRTSRFDARSVERLAGKRRGGVRVGGLAVVLGTGLTLIEPERVSYRGRDAGELARRVAFERVARWLWLGEEPPDADAAEPRSPWIATAGALDVARDTQRSLPDGTSTADRVRAIASAVGPTDPLRFDLTPRAVAATMSRLIAVMVDGLPSRQSGGTRDLVFEAKPPAEAGGSDGSSETIEHAIASRLWRRLTERPATAEDLVALNAALVLVADHGLAASTLAARVAASVRADPVSVVTSGLGTLAGPLHGAASAPVHRLFDEVDHPDRATAVLGDFMRRENRIPGFGHLIYKDWDPRARVLLGLLRAGAGEPRRLEVVESMLELLLERIEVRPNVDFALGAMSYVYGMNERAGETLFAIARSAGWTAHALEEYHEPPLRFRPRAHYTGPAPEGGESVRGD